MSLNENYLICILMNFNVASRKTIDCAKFENACTVLLIDVMGLNENYLICIFMNINVASHKITDHANFENGCTNIQ